MEEVHHKMDVFFGKATTPLTLLSFFSYMLRGDTQKLYYPSLARIVYIWYKSETVYYSKSEIRSQILLQFSSHNFPRV